MNDIGGVCPFLGGKCKSCKGKRIRICEAVEPRKRTNADNCVDFGDCMMYQAKMVEVNKLL